MAEHDPNVEIQRLQCLQALGITMYHPRYRLPGAKPSEHGVWPEAGLAARAEAPPQNAAPAHAERGEQRAANALRVEREAAPRAATATRPEERAAPRGDVPRPAVDLPRAPRSEAPPAQGPAPVAHGAEPAPAAVQNFQLLFLQVDDDLALVNQIPALSRPQLQDRQLALLTNLLRWLGKAVPAQTPRMFRWPLPGLESMAASMSPQTSLLHFLEQASSERRFRFLLQLGPQAVAPTSSAWQAFATHSLDEMLALPALKREAWQSLLPLHALLHAGA